MDLRICPVAILSTSGTSGFVRALVQVAIPSSLDPSGLVHAPLQVAVAPLLCPDAAYPRDSFHNLASVRKVTSLLPFDCVWPLNLGQCTQCDS